MLLEGIFLPLTTPFRADGRLFLSKLESNVARYSLTPAQGLLILGREGEGGALTDRETEAVLRTAITAAADEKVMIANVGRESVAATMELAEIAAEAGYDAITLAPPLGYEGQTGAQSGVLFRVVADRSPLPVVIVNHLEHPLSHDAISELAQHPQIIGAIQSGGELPLKRLIDSTATVTREVTVTNIFGAVTGRMLRHAAPAGNFVSAASLGGLATLAVPATPVLKTRRKRVGFQVLAGSGGSMLESWNAGAVGAVPRLAACAPQVCCEVWQAFKDGDPALAAEKQQRILEAAQLLEGSPGMRDGIAALKYGCDLNAYFGGSPRLPLLPLTAIERAAVETALIGLRN